LKFISQIAEQNSESGWARKRRYGFGLVDFPVFQPQSGTKTARFQVIIQRAVSLVKRLDFATFPGVTHGM
jgi:hypothetical protein